MMIADRYSALIDSFPLSAWHTADPSLFARLFLHILDKDGNLIPLDYNRVQHDYMRNRTPRDLVLKPRQTGISTAIQAENFRAVTTHTALVATLSHDDDTTQVLRRMINRFYDNLPPEFAPLRDYSNDRYSTWPDFGSEWLIATAGSKQKGRGTTRTHIHLSEIAYYADASAIQAGLLQSGRPQYIVAESTPNGAQGWFYQQCMEALDGNNEWRLHFYPWWWDDDYQILLQAGEVVEFTDEELALVEAHNLTASQIKWRRAKQRELKHLFAQEYPEDVRKCFLRSGFGYFGDIDHVFVVPFDLTYDPTHMYVAGLDFAQTQDFTDMSVIDATTRVEVDRLHVNQLSWSEMRRQVCVLCRKWRVRVLQAERNSMGSTNIEELQYALSSDPETRAVSLVSFETTNESKARIMAALHEGLHSSNPLRLLEDPIQRHELGAFVASQLPSGAWRLAASDGEHDDSVISLALAYDQVVNYSPYGGFHFGR